MDSVIGLIASYLASDANFSSDYVYLKIQKELFYLKSQKESLDFVNL